MKSILTLYSLCVLVFLVSCNTEVSKKEKKINNIINNSKKSDKNNLFVDVFVEEESLSQGLVKGNIKYFFKVDDTLKIQKKDTRYVYMVLGLKAHKKNEDEGDLFKKELSFTPIKTNDTVIIPFHVKAKFQGNATIVGGIKDDYVLSYYHKKEDKVRIITYECTFEKDVYIGVNKPKSSAMAIK